jgi:hypothetical protein
MRSRIGRAVRHRRTVRNQSDCVRQRYGLRHRQSGDGKEEPIPLRILFAGHPELLAPVLQIIHRVIARFLTKQVRLKRNAADTGAVTLIQRFGSASRFGTSSCCALTG